MSDEEPNKDRAPGVQAKPNDDAWERFLANVKTIGGAVLLAIFIRIVLFEAFQIDGPSMEPTLLNGDRVVVAKYAYGLFPHPWANEAIATWGEPERGDVVIVRSPMDNQDIVKRVIAIGGDTVEVREGEIFLNGAPIAPEDLGPCEERAQRNPIETCHLYGEDAAGRPYRTSHSSDWRLDDYGYFRSGAMEIPEGHVFVMGDHRDQSNDSRNPLVGAVPISRIKGRARFIYLSSDPDSASFWWERMRWYRMGESLEWSP